MAYQIIATGTSVTSSGITASTAIPNNANGTRARLVCLVSDGEVYVKMGNSSVTATTNDLIINSFPRYFNVRPTTHIAYLEKTAGAILNIAPVED